MAVIPDVLKPFAPASKLVLHDNQLSRGAKLLHGILAGESRQEQCFPGHARLAELMGCSVRTVYRLLKELRDRGWLRTRRRGQGLNDGYQFTVPDRIPMSDPDRTPMSDPDRTPMSDPDRTPMSDPDRTPMSDPYTCLAQELRQDSSSKKAAADAAHGQEGNPRVEPVTAELTAINALAELGLPRPQAVEKVRARPRLAAAIASYCRWRFSARRMRPVGSRAGFIIAMFDDPEQHGFEETPEGEWLLPRESPGRAMRERMAAVRAERHACHQAAESVFRSLMPPEERPRLLRPQAAVPDRERLRRAEEARYERLSARWDSLPAEEQEERRRRVLARPEMALFTVDELGVLRACWRELELELGERGLRTLGDLDEFRAKHQLAEVPGIGAAKVGKIEAAVAEYWRKNLVCETVASVAAATEEPGE
jgi:hypothetical protein